MNTLIYQVNQEGGFSGNLYLCSLEDAKKICSSPKTKGAARGGSWCLMFTTLENFFNWNGKDTIIIKKDDGRNDELFKELGVKVLKNQEFADFLTSIGIKSKIK